MNNHALEQELYVIEGNGNEQIVWTEEDRKSLIVGLIVVNANGGNKFAALKIGDHIVFKASLNANDTRIEELSLPVPTGAEVRYEADAGVFLTLTTVERGQ
ncbi:MAG: hypothetical protein N4A65_00355 [Cohaesibacter sp.]|jgi:hypothetical protein|nr:hypothetical protein [Cohaesibacter sp.]